MVGVACLDDTIKALPKTGMKRGFPPGQRHMMIAKWFRFPQDLLQNRNGKEKILVLLRVSPVDIPEAVATIEIADVIQFNSNSWHRRLFPSLPHPFDHP